MKFLLINSLLKVNHLQLQKFRYLKEVFWRGWVWGSWMVFCRQSKAWCATSMAQLVDGLNNYLMLLMSSKFWSISLCKSWELCLQAGYLNSQFVPSQKCVGAVVWIVLAFSYLISENAPLVRVKEGAASRSYCRMQNKGVVWNSLLQWKEKKGAACVSFTCHAFLLLPAFYVFAVSFNLCVNPVRSSDRATSNLGWRACVRGCIPGWAAPSAKTDFSPCPPPFYPC